MLSFRSHEHRAVPSMRAPSRSPAPMRCAEATRARRAPRSSGSSARARQMPRASSGSRTRAADLSDAAGGRRRARQGAHARAAQSARADPQGGSPGRAGRRAQRGLVLSVRDPRRSAGRRDARRRCATSSRAPRRCANGTPASSSRFSWTGSRGLGLPTDRAATRFAHSLDIAARQEAASTSSSPASTASPSCRRSSSTTARAFPWLDRVEAATPDIRAELIVGSREDCAIVRALRPGVCRGDRKGTSPDWRTIRLERVLPVEGRRDRCSTNAARCPKTMSALAEAPLVRVRNRSPVGPLLAAAPRRPHSASHGARQHPPDLPPAA